jgi:hypothetical protein
MPFSLESSLTFMYGTREGKELKNNVFVPRILPGRTGDPHLDRATAEANRVNIAVAVTAMKSAVAAGVPDCALVLPSKDWLVASAPARGDAPPSPGVSAEGGGHFVGQGALPRSNGWATACIWIDGINGFSVIAGGGKIIRIENDPYNSRNENDQFNSTILITRCKNFTISGELIGEGYQEVYTKTTSGTFLDISYGCSNFIVTASVCNDKGTNVVAIGMNRASGFSGIKGISGYDISQPCLNWKITGDIIGYNGEHAVFINVSDMGMINNIKGKCRQFSFSGRIQPKYIQRCLYLLSCGNIEIGSVESYDSHKAGVILSAYDDRRSYKSINAKIGYIYVQSPENQDDDYYIALCINNQCDDIDHANKISADIGTLVTRGVKSGVQLIDKDSPSMENFSVISELCIAEVDIKATMNGINISPYGQVNNVKINNGEISVLSDKTFSAIAAPVGGVIITSRSQERKGGNAKYYNMNVLIGNLVVKSGNRVCYLAMIKNLSIDSASFNYVRDDNVDNPVSTRFRMVKSTTGSCMNFSTN